MELRLAGKTAMVCGASQGLGHAIAQGFLAEGVRVIALGRDVEKIRTNFVGAKNLLPVAVDFTSVDSVTKFLEQKMTADILVNNTGGPTPTAAENTRPEQFQAGYTSIFEAATRLIGAVLPGMRAQGYGRIINLTSIAAIEPIPHLAISTAMRAGLTAYAKLLSQEVASAGITVNTVMPGVIGTQRIIDLRTAKAQRESTTLELELEKTRKEIPAKRLGLPEELAHLVVFLASPLAAYINGQNIAVDGGLSRSI